MLELQVDAEAIRTSSIHPDLVGPHAFRDGCQFIFYISLRIDLVEYVPLVFLSRIILDFVLVPFLQVFSFSYIKLFLSFDDHNVRWLMVNK